MEIGKSVVIFAWLLALSIMDIRTKRIPIWMLVIGGLGAICLPTDAFSVLAFLPGGILLLLAVGGKAGYADAIVLLVLGAMVGARMGMTIFLVSLFLLSGVAISFLGFRKIKGESKMPYLPFLTAAFVVQRGTCFWG